MIASLGSRAIARLVPHGILQDSLALGVEDMIVVLGILVFALLARIGIE